MSNYDKLGYDKSKNKELYENDNIFKDAGANNVQNLGNNIFNMNESVGAKKSHDQNVMQDQETILKAKYINDAKKAGVSEKDTEKTIKDIDNKTSIDANDKQGFGQNQGGKYQHAVDRNNLLNPIFHPNQTKLKEDALELYNRERDTKKSMNSLYGTDDRDNNRVDQQVNTNLGVNQHDNANTNTTGRNVQPTVNKYTKANDQIDSQVSNVLLNLANQNQSTSQSNNDNTLGL